jgi:hypothetical protein
MMSFQKLLTQAMNNVAAAAILLSTNPDAEGAISRKRKKRTVWMIPLLRAQQAI